MQDAVRGAHSLHTAGLPSQARATLTSVGFVYLHPMTDGNGRISRFLINDILRRDGALPAQVHRMLTKRSTVPWVELEPSLAIDTNLAPQPPQDRNERWHVIVRRLLEKDE